MKNTDVIPFERNRYYAGKMLTSSDFLAEQTYNNNKRRFLNQTVVGSGIICGCGVFCLDDLSVLVESGAAIDSMGREIVIENSVVKKLSAITGFEALRTNQAMLCVRYKEDDVHAVYTVNRQEGESEYEYNRVTEGYELFLMDEEEAEQEIEMDTEFFAGSPILDTPDYTVSFRMPTTVCCDRYVKLELVIIKKSDRECHLDYEAVDYWQEICEIMEWTKTHVYSTLHICWAAMAGLYYHFGIPKYQLPKKMFGVFQHAVKTPYVQLLRGFDDVFLAPHSRHSEVHREDIEQVKQLQILTESPLAGVHIVANNNGRQYFITGHFEYDRKTLAEEYFRDLQKGCAIDLPYGYFPQDDPTQEPLYTWRCSANLLFSNWLNHCVYQLTPYDLHALQLYNWNWDAGL